MDPEELSRRAHALALAEEAGQVPGFAGLEVASEAGGHAVLAGRPVPLEVRCADRDPVSGTPRYTLVLHAGALDGEAMLERALLFGLERVAERAAADDAIGGDDALFQAHAAFVRGMEVPAGWYRCGERLAPDAWAVDLDVFVDLVLEREAWDAIRGTRVTLALLGEDLEVEIPEEAQADEAWTLEGAGLFEPAPGIDEDELAEDDGRYGDLHVVPYVY